MKPAPTTDHARALLERRAQRERVVERAQREQARERGCAGQRPRDAPGRDHEPVVGIVSPFASATRRARRRATARGHAEPQVERERVERLGLVEADLLGLAIAAQQLLRERRPIVGPLPLLAHEHEPAREAAAAQRLGAADPGERAADDRRWCRGTRGGSGRAGRRAR
jgi:hypothetical protein